MTKFRIVIFIRLLISCSTKKSEYGNAELSQKITLTDITRIKENPTDFDNDTLKIEGKLNLTLENKGINNIWIHSFKPATVLDSVWKKMNGQKVKLIGLYKSGKTGHLGLYNGEFTEIYYIKME